MASVTAAALLAGAAALAPEAALAGSCCGGGSATSLIVPKYAWGVADLSFDAELYDGYWDQGGRHRSDPPGSDLRQYRVNLGYGQRIARDWQAGITLPYVWNDNDYSGLSSRSNGLGDTTVSLWYEALDDESTWRVRRPADLIPGVTLGLSLLLPTGLSPYDDEKSSFDVTGRGFYRLDGNLLIDKTVRPWSASASFSYGTHFERSVNREYGRYVEPYSRQLGDRLSTSVSLGYSYPIGSGGDVVAATVSYSYLHEGDGTINGAADGSTAFRKQSVGGQLAWSSSDHDWSARAGWNHAVQEEGWGTNFPTTDIFTVGVRYVFR